METKPFKPQPHDSDCDCFDCCMRREEDEKVEKVAKAKLAEAITKVIIQQRHQQYGSYETQAGVAQLIKYAIFETVPQNQRPTLSQPQIESLQMIATKISRIVCGNPNNIDSWRDIAGYATLIADLLQKDQLK